MVQNSSLRLGVSVVVCVRVQKSIGKRAAYRSVDFLSLSVWSSKIASGIYTGGDLTGTFLLSTG